MPFIDHTEVQQVMMHVRTHKGKVTEMTYNIVVKLREGRSVAETVKWPSPKYYGVGHQKPGV